VKILQKGLKERGGVNTHVLSTGKKKKGEVVFGEGGERRRFDNRVKKNKVSEKMGRWARLAVIVF